MYDGPNKVEGDGFTIVLLGRDEDDDADMVVAIVDGIAAVDGALDDCVAATDNGSDDDTVAYIGGACVWGGVVCDGPVRSHVMPCWRWWWWWWYL